ncbi:hypothetical protein Tco_0311744 [Tanacetum coccineum]
MKPLIFVCYTDVFQKFQSPHFFRLWLFMVIMKLQYMKALGFYAFEFEVNGSVFNVRRYDSGGALKGSLHVKQPAMVKEVGAAANIAMAEGGSVITQFLLQNGSGEGQWRLEENVQGTKAMEPKKRNSVHKLIMSAWCEKDDPNILMQMVSILDRMGPLDDMNDLGKLSETMPRVMRGKLEALIDVSQKMCIRLATFCSGSAALMALIMSVHKLLDDQEAYIAYYYLSKKNFFMNFLLILYTRLGAEVGAESGGFRNRKSSGIHLEILTADFYYELEELKLFGLIAVSDKYGLLPDGGCHLSEPDFAYVPLFDVDCCDAIDMHESSITDNLRVWLLKRLMSKNQVPQGIHKQEQSPIISQGVEEQPQLAHFDDPCHELLHEVSISQGSSSNVQSS